MHTSPSGRSPGFVDLCIISSNWNVFEPGAAHTGKSAADSQKKLSVQKIIIRPLLYIRNI